MRSSGARPKPEPTAARTDPLRMVFPSTVTLPADALRAPYTVSRISERPEPTSPASPTISPARTVNVTSVNSPGRDRPSTCSTGSPSVAVSSCSGKTNSIDRPVISRISSAVGVSATGRLVATVRPSLRTVTRSPISRISSRRCEM